MPNEITYGQGKHDSIFVINYLSSTCSHYQKDQCCVSVRKLLMATMLLNPSLLYFCVR